MKLLVAVCAGTVRNALVVDARSGRRVPQGCGRRREDRPGCRGWRVRLRSPRWYDGSTDTGEGSPATPCCKAAPMAAIRTTCLPKSGSSGRVRHVSTPTTRCAGKTQLDRPGCDLMGGCEEPPVPIPSRATIRAPPMLSHRLLGFMAHGKTASDRPTSPGRSRPTTSSSPLDQR